MTERKLTMLPVEIDGYCDPESGVCEVPALADSAAPSTQDPGSGADPATD